MMQILVVDDDFEMQMTIRLLLTLVVPGAEIIQASDGEKAIVEALVRHPDLILLDGNMPKMDGYEVAQVLRLLPDARNIPLICISGGSDRDPMLIRLRELCTLSLPKPISIDALTMAISEIRKVSCSSEG